MTGFKLMGTSIPPFKFPMFEWVYLKMEKLEYHSSLKDYRNGDDDDIVSWYW